MRGRSAWRDMKTIWFQFAGNGKHDKFVVRMRQKLSTSAVMCSQQKAKRGDMDDGRISEGVGGVG